MVVLRGKALTITVECPGGCEQRLPVWSQPTPGLYWFCCHNCDLVVQGRDVDAIGDDNDRDGGAGEDGGPGDEEAGQVP